MGRQCQSDVQKGDGVGGWKNSCLCSKAADSPLFFQLLTATTNSAYSVLAYGNKAVCEITTGIQPPLSTITSPLQKLSLVHLVRLWQGQCFLLDKMTPFTPGHLLTLLWRPKANSFLYLSLVYRPISIWRTLHVPTPFHAVLKAASSPLSGHYYGNASLAQKKAEQKTSSLRQELLAESSLSHLHTEGIHNHTNIDLDK